MALRNSVQSQAKIVVVVRKTFSITIKLHLGVGSVFFALVKSIFTSVPQGKIDHRCASSEVMTIQKLIIHMCRIRTTSHREAARTNDEAARSSFSYCFKKKLLKLPTTYERKSRKSRYHEYASNALEVANSPLLVSSNTKIINFF